MDRLDLTNTIWFLGWLIALAVLFVLGLRLPLQPSLRRLPAFGYVTGIVTATLGLLVLANVALVLHDAHFDLTREGVFTPAKEAENVVDGLSRDVKLTYFYQSQDQEGRRAKDMVEVLGRRNPRLHVRTVDPDKQPTVADTYGVRIYNAAVLEMDGRRIQVMSTDEDQIALGILRVTREQVTTVCFMEGHGEYPMENFEFHTHFEGVAGHGHGAGARVPRLRRPQDHPGGIERDPGGLRGGAGREPALDLSPGRERSPARLPRPGWRRRAHVRSRLRARAPAGRRAPEGGRGGRAGRRHRSAGSLLDRSGGGRGPGVRDAPDHPADRADVLPGYPLPDSAAASARRDERSPLSQQPAELHAARPAGGRAPARPREPRAGRGE